MEERLFTGFPRDFLMLLAENSFNDSRTYYEAHKEEIKNASTVPMRALCADLSDELFKLDSEMNLVPSKMVSRVRRDTRVAKNQNMYRSNMWAMFMRDKYMWGYFPCMWFEVQPGGWSCGIGMFNSDPTFMAAFRDVVLRYPNELKMSVASVLKTGAVVDIEQYKKPKSGSDGLDKAIQPYFNSKHMYFICYSENLEPLFDGSVEDILKEKFKAFRPFYKYILTVCDLLTEQGKNAPRRMR